ncbi:MAG: aspartate carbamoyltransferase [Nitrososphaerota archaeon]|nr:aspartate carbamoyltransferase [Nitrososphaerota archaeon]MDG6940194.1 aspartate carbamoyltransferase [Nitrososphaerota archaeon]
MPKDALKGRDFIAITDVSRRELEALFETADYMQKHVKGGTDALKGRILCTLFFEPSTRTRLSFETAMLRLGGGVTGFADPSASRTVTGESLADTVRMADSYGNAIVLRHRIEGAARLASQVAQVPIINAGDGTQHHPTQTLTDLYTIRKEFGTVDGTSIAILGDLKHTRSASSLCLGLTHFKDVSLFLVSPEQLRTKDEVKDLMKAARLNFVETDDVEKVIPQVDALYVTRVQKERITPEEYEKARGSYIITAKMLKRAKDKMIVMHHLPRIEEIPLEVDYTRHARYFEQAANGLPVRMSLLSHLVE